VPAALGASFLPGFSRFASFASYRRFWEESFDKLDVVVNQMKKDQMKKAEARNDKKHSERDRADGRDKNF
jgi:hypothetical protein